MAKQYSLVSEQPKIQFGLRHRVERVFELPLPSQLEGQHLRRWLVALRLYYQAWLQDVES
jgi:hypothetical protein